MVYISYTEKISLLFILIFIAFLTASYLIPIGATLPNANLFIVPITLFFAIIAGFSMARAWSEYSSMRDAVSGEITAIVNAYFAFSFLFLLGIEMKTESVIKYLKPSLKMSITSFILPLVFSIILSVLLLHFGLRQDFIVSLAIAVPSISIISVLIMRYRLARDPKGITIIGSVVITDVIAFLLLGIAYKNALNAILLVVYFVIFLMIFLNVDKILNRGSEKLRTQLTRYRKILKSEHFGYAMIIVIGLLTGGISQLIGVNYIIGVFFAGLIIHEGLIGRTLFRKVSRTIKRMNDGFFIPLFFGIAGIDVSSFHSIEIYMPAIIIISVSVITFSIILNYFSSGKVMKMKKKQWRIKTSAIINGRGAVGIAIATVAFELGVITNSAYSIVILATIIISIIATSLLRNA